MLVQCSLHSFGRGKKESTGKTAERPDCFITLRENYRLSYGVCVRGQVQLTVLVSLLPRSTSLAARQTVEKEKSRA